MNFIYKPVIYTHASICIPHVFFPSCATFSRLSQQFFVFQVTPLYCGSLMLQVRNKVGEELYVAINKSHPTLAGKLTGMFLEATEVLCI